HYSELDSLKKIKNIKLEQFGGTCFIKNNPQKKDFTQAKNGLKKLKKIIGSKKYNMVILDEANVALRFQLIKLDDVLNLCRKIPKNTELILTGRYAPKELFQTADLVSEIKESKHYYKKGHAARKGIEY
ncbi:MAG: cob(I)yrinic acid a,c-diamide adenosyltransferase, partial [Candidatus Omnitrophota bacterium]